MLTAVDAVAVADRAEHGDTRTRLIQAAIGLYAEQGLDGASLRSIVLASGVRNASAVQYHFGGKAGLVRAAVDYLADLVFPPGVALLQSLQSEMGERPVTVREIVEATYGPVLAFSLSSSQNLNAVRIFPALLQHPDPATRNLFVNACADLRELSDTMLVAALPEVPAQVVRLKAGFALVNVLHLVTDLHVLYGAAEVVSDPSILRRVYDYFLDYVSGGIESERQGSAEFRRFLARTGAEYSRPELLS